MKRSDSEIIVNITTKVKEKLNFNQIANNHDEVIFNPEKFPGLIIQSDIPKATIVLYSTQNIFIAGLHHRYEVDQVVEKLSKLLREEGIEFKDPEIYIDDLKPIMLKICILGEKGVGKSTLIDTILENSDEKQICYGDASSSEYRKNKWKIKKNSLEEIANSLLFILNQSIDIFRAGIHENNSNAVYSNISDSSAVQIPLERVKTLRKREVPVFNE